MESIDRETMFFCQRDGLRIRGMQYLPEASKGEGPYPVIIASHGFTGDYTSEAEYCRIFTRWGYAAFSFSFCGGSRTLAPEELKSEGETTETTVWTQVEDLIAVIRYVKALPYIDEKNLILFGCSQGGLISGLTAAKLGEEIKKLVMVFPALCIPDHARMGGLGGARYDVESVPDILDCGAILLGRVFHDTAVGMDVYKELRPYQGPVLILQGLEDMVVNYSYAIRAKENYAPGQCRLQLIRDMGHGVTEEQRESAAASVRQFLLEREELLTIRVIITYTESEERDDCRESRIYFTGYCDTELFHGTVLPGGCDTQKYYKDGSRDICADYTLEGLDRAGERCRIHIVNRDVGGEWRPTIDTDSKALAWLNGADATAVLEGAKEGPVVRIYSCGQ
ncbi:MAG: alpha/beta hydrolase [Roseburia sp.]|nr:alpha/beta hydrolase [Roseburia sp.]MCM1097445.1 alpha/beta hydrolase [Ruminococcus flavefaciens]